ncbi:MAG: glycosyltransferase [Nitrososphaerota archaeon]|nr:glycosyltransferase [Nitrososphaerota archaeon]
MGTEEEGSGFSGSVLFICNNLWPGYSDYFLSHSQMYVEIAYCNPWGNDSYLVKGRTFEGGKLTDTWVFGQRIRRLMFYLRKLHPEILELFIGIYLFASIARIGKRYDISVVASSLPFLLVIKTFGITRRLVYASGDVRLAVGSFPKRVLDYVVVSADKLMDNHSDSVWYLSRQMFDFKIQHGVIKNSGIHRAVVGLPIEKYLGLEPSLVKRHSIVYMGTISKGRGLDVLIAAIADLSKRVSDLSLIVIGQVESSYAHVFDDTVRRSGCYGVVRVLGFLPNPWDIMSKCAFGVALYQNPVIRYTDSLKLKQYIKCGLPVICTDLPATAREIAEANAGLIIGSELKDLTSAMAKMLVDDSYWLQCKERVPNLFRKLEHDTLAAIGREFSFERSQVV